MIKLQISHVWLTLFSLGSVLIAGSSVSELQLKLDDLRKQDHALWQQKNEVQKQIHQTQADIRVVENAESFDAAVKSLKFQLPKKPRTVLIYSRTQGFRHDSIPYGVYALTELGKRTGAFNVVSTEDPAVFSSLHFMSYDGVIMLNTTGNEAIPKGEAREAFEAFLMDTPGARGVWCHFTTKSRSTRSAVISLLAIRFVTRSINIATTNISLAISYVFC